MACGDLRIPGPDDLAPEQHVNQAAKAFGLVIEEGLLLEEDFFLWPENVAAFNFWLSVQTQWKWTSVPAGMGGTRAWRTGLDYQGVDVCLRYLDAKKKDKRWYFGAVRAMERAALDEWAKER